MTTKYKALNSPGIYFISFAVVDWIEVFTRIFKKAHLYFYSSASFHSSGMGLLDVVLMEFPISMVGYKNGLILYIWLRMGTR